MATSEKPSSKANPDPLQCVQYGIERDPRGHLVQCPTHSMANFKLLGQVVTIHSYCLKTEAF